MPSTTVYNMAGEAVEELELSELVFGVIPNVPVLHQVVTAQLVNRRQGNASTKTRSEVLQAERNGACSPGKYSRATVPAWWCRMGSKTASLSS